MEIRIVTVIINNNGASNTIAEKAKNMSKSLLLSILWISILRLQLIVALRYAIKQTGVLKFLSLPISKTGFCSEHKHFFIPNGKNSMV